MKKFILFALCAIVALAGCQKIDENGVNPGQSAFKVTAVIADNSTKVDYEVVDNTVSPKWVEGDKIFGYDGTGTFTFTVSGVDDKGMATFDAGDYTPEDGTTLYAVYYPAKGATDFTSGELAVDLTSQNGVLDGTAPAIMCATATVEGDAVNFHFYNQTAIIGVKKFQVNPGETVSTFKASGLVATGTIKVVGEALALVPDTNPADMTITCNYAADATTGMYENPVYFIAMPTADANIVLNAAGTSLNYAAKSVASDIEAGNYYYMSKKLSGDPVARYSNDGGTTWTYTANLVDAVNGIASTTMNEDGIVELLKDYTLGEQIKTEGVKFTLNGGGHTLTVPLIKSGKDTVFGAIYPVASSDVTIEGITIQSSSSRGSAVRTEGSVVTLGKDCIIKGFSTYKNGGAIWGNPASTIYMTENSRIIDCHCENPTFGGGAICSEGMVYIGDDAIISDCSTTIKDGGAVLVNSTKAKLTLYGNALIENCTAATSGGAIRGTNSAVIEIKDNAHITGCKALNGSGGAICDNYTGASITISGNVVIDKCTATNFGGAFYHSGTFTVKGNAKIEGCSAKFGGGIAMWRKGTIDENALIKDCTAERGGAVYDTTATANYGVLEMKGNSCIDGCEAQRGGGIYTCQTNATSCTVTGNASIINCVVKHTAKTVYAGTAIFANSVLNVSGDVLFSGNTAQTTAASPSIYGNIIMSASSKGNVTISGGTFLSNAMWNCMATADAGSKMTVSGGCFANAGSGSIFSYAFTNSNKVVVSGGYFNKSITDSARATLATGYKLAANPNTSEADQAASALGCTYKVVAQ